MTTISIAAIQMSCGAKREENVDRAETFVREATSRGANIVLLPELFEGPYFPQDEDPECFALARPAEGNDTLERMSSIARELNVVLPVSFFEKVSVCCFNSVMIIDADGSYLGIYRKSHIPQDISYFEKFYFAPGYTGFKVWPTRFGNLGVGICWDQWFPEAARVMTLKGADFLFYPTAIGSDPVYPGGNPKAQWQTCIRGHSAANWIPIVISNRTGHEEGSADTSIDFFGSSIITDTHGEVLQQAQESQETVLVQEFNLEEVRAARFTWGMMRDRRPDLYGPILSLDGQTGV